MARRVVVEAVCVSTPETRVAKKVLSEAVVGPFGVEGDRHGTQFRVSRSTGREFPNGRQWSAVSSEEVEAVCTELGVEPFALGAMGENFRLRGILLAEVLPGTVFEFPSGCRLRVGGQNDPCENAAAELGATYGPNVERFFVRVSYGRRGVIGTVLTAGLVRVGDEVHVVVPEETTAPAP